MSRSFRALKRVNTPLICALYLFSAAPKLRAQTCVDQLSPPVAPSSFPVPNSVLTIYEGPVAPDPIVGGFQNGLFRGQTASVAVDGSVPAKFVVAWQAQYCSTSNPSSSSDPIFLNRFSASDGHCLTWGPLNVYGPKVISGLYPGSGCATANNYLEFPSVALSNDGWTRVGWTGEVGLQCFEEPESVGGRQLLLYQGFKFTDDPATMWPAPTTASTSGNGDAYPSVAITAQNTRMVTWTRPAGSPPGLIYDPVAAGDGALRGCGSQPLCDSFYARWQPAVAASGNYFVVCFADPEVASDPDSNLNIKMQLFDTGGNKKGSEIFVNDTYSEPDLSTQDSPAVAFEGQDVVVCWEGPLLRREPPSSGSCSPTTPGNTTNIYARRYHLNLQTQRLEAVGAPLTVNNDAGFKPFGAADTRPKPSVAISKEGNSRFIVAWTALNVTPSDPAFQQRVRAQYFEGANPLGREFTINQDNSVGPGGVNYPVQRSLANSAQHTIAYGADGRVVCAWSTIYYDDSPPEPNHDTERVYFTILPPTYGDYRALHDSGTGSGCKGDMNYDGAINGLDIQLFINVILGANGHRCHSYIENYWRADLVPDGTVDMNDLSCFVSALLAGQNCPYSGCTTEQGQPLYDCDQNETDDRDEIAAAPGLDCNHNNFLDECEPLVWQWTGIGASDCNANGVPDDCESFVDCNSNGVLDSCEVYFGTAADCNHNGVPDSCDIAAGTALDCNHNGIPDSCDIATHHSKDINRNHIPDECEDLAGPEE